MTSTSHDAPRVLLFPPLIPIATIILSAVLQWLYPLGVLRHIPFWLSAFIGVALLAVGLPLMIRANLVLMRNGTAVRPSLPTVRLVTSGVYARTRNPMYLGGSLAMFAIAFLFTLDWLPLLYLPGAVLLHLGIIVPEEQYLESKFGEEYRRYSAKVPRYFGAGFER